MTAFVCRRTGQAYQIGEQLDQDGQAVVHAVVSGGPDLALKQYLPATLQRRPDLEARIKAMIANPPAYRPAPSGPVICAWPEDAAYTSGQFTGFVMPRVDTREAATVPDLAARPATTWQERVAVAVNLARAVAMLHDRDVVIGDFRKWNLLTWSDCRVTLLGCDRMQVVDPESGRQFPCVAGRDACTPPSCSFPPRCPARSGRAAATSSGSPCICTCCCSRARTLSEGGGPVAGTALPNTCSPRKGCGRTPVIGGSIPARARRR